MTEARREADPTADPPGPRLRSALREIPRYIPGRPPAVQDGMVTYKISSNENPYPPLPGVLRVIEQAARVANRYPDLGASGLIAAIARRFEVPVEHVAVGTGSVGVCQQIVQATAGPGDEVVFAWRSFEAYPIIVQVSGATAVRIPLRPDETHDLEAMAGAITPATRCVFVCNPNNPTGAVARRAELEKFLDAVPTDVLVVLDEAYREFVRDADVPDGLDLYRERPNVCVLRTFSKAYGLAALRVGFAIAHEPVAVALRKTAVPFGVSTIAQEAAVASLAAEDELTARVTALVAERERLRQGLVAAGWTVRNSEANFVWIRTGPRTAEFAAACEAAGTTVRPYAEDGVRITVGEPEATDVVLGVAGGLDWRV